MAIRSGLCTFLVVGALVNACGGGARSATAPMVRIEVVDAAIGAAHGDEAHTVWDSTPALVNVVQAGVWATFLHAPYAELANVTTETIKTGIKPPDPMGRAYACTTASASTST